MRRVAVRCRAAAPNATYRIRCESTFSQRTSERDMDIRGHGHLCTRVLMKSQSREYRKLTVGPSRREWVDLWSGVEPSVAITTRWQVFGVQLRHLISCLQ